jgi:hypothetical protein
MLVRNRASFIEAQCKRTFSPTSSSLLTKDYFFFGQNIRAVAIPTKEIPSSNAELPTSGITTGRATAAFVSVKKTPKAKMFRVILLFIRFLISSVLRP